MNDLSKDLLPIYELELELGNEVARIDENMWTRTPYAVVFKLPLHKQEIETTLVLPPQVRYHETRDAHYGFDAFYYSEDSRHAVIGPLPGSKLHPPT